MNTPTTLTPSDAGKLRWSGGWPRRLPVRSMREIATDTATECGLRVADLRGRYVPRPVSHVRQYAMAAMHAEGFSHHQIIRFFGLKDHTTSIWACRAVAERNAMRQQEAA